jgi:hypothetical protein
MSDLFGDNTITGDFAAATALSPLDTSNSSAGSDPTGAVSYDIPPVGSLLTLDPFLFPAGSANQSDASIPSGDNLLTPTMPAPQTATAGTAPGTTWAPLLGAGAAILNADLLGQKSAGIIQPGLTQVTHAVGASVGAKSGASPIKTLFDTTNQGVTGQQLVIGAVALLLLVYGINKLV